MKTLKQLREEYNGKFMSQVEVLPEELVLESKDNEMASYKDMPSLLIFRRLSFRLYPKKQVVALYYSKLLDKYLSIPFGPGGNLNLSESVISDTLDEACWNNYKQEGMKKKGNKMVPNCVPVEEDGPVMSRYTERPTYESFKDKVEKLREERMNEGLADVADTVADIAVPYYSAGKKLYKGDYKGAAKDAAVDTAMMAVGGPLTRVAAKGLKAGAGLVRKGIGKLAGKSAAKGVVARDASAIAKSASKPKPSSPVKSGLAGAAGGIAADAAKDAMSGGSNISTDVAVKGLYRDTPHGKAYSSWQTASGKDPVYQSKLKQAQLKENSISDIRNMVKEGIDNMDLSINGRTITLNTSMAKRILEVYDSVNIKNKKIVEGMLNEDLESFKKLINFSIRN